MPRLLLVAALLFSVTASAARVPWTGRKTVVKVSLDQERALAADLAEALLAESTTLADERSEILERVVTRLARHVPGKADQVDWRASLVDSDEVVSYALSDGTVVVSAGLFAVLQTEAELAALVAHDMAHVAARHGAERITGELLLTGLLTDDELSLADPSYGSSIAGAFGTGAALGVVLPFSRKHEDEADLIALRLVATAGYDPSALGKALDRLVEGFGDSGQLTWLSTHPSSAKRGTKLAEARPDAMKAYGKADMQYGHGLRLP